MHVDPRDALMQHFHVRGHLLQQHLPDGEGRAARQGPASEQEPDTRARSSNGGYPPGSPGTDLSYGLERSSA
jgi:hypothetical protein